MTKGFHKKSSKRIPAKRRYNIEKKVREHNKKLKKQMKKKKSITKPKDIGVPNSLPFKDLVIRDAVEDRRRADEYRELVRDQLKSKRKEEKDKQLMRNRNIDLSQLKTDAENRSQEFEKNSLSVDVDSGKAEKSASNLKSYYKEFQKVIDASDVVIQVLDSRDPLGSRCPQVEESIIKKGANKRLILLLNKVDLIPRDNLEKWLKYLRNEFPTVAFKASTQSQKSNLSRSKVNVLMSSDQLLQSNKCLGADILMKLLSNYCRNKDIKTSITVGIVGFPNVGKSSVINSLKRSHVCNVGAIPGMTKTMQSVSLDKHIKLLDSPGIVFANTNHTEGNESLSSLMALRNAVKVESLADPIRPVQALLNRVNREELMLFYRLPAFNDVNDFLALLAKRFGKLKKGGLLNVENAARKVLNDWNVGKIKYYTVPPEVQALPSHISSEIVSQMSKEFDINDFIYDQQMDEINTNFPQKVSETAALVVDSLGLTALQDNGDTVVDMEADNGQIPIIKTNIVLKERKSKVIVDEEMKDLCEGMQLNKAKKVHFKKAKKQRKRNAKLANKLSQSLESNVSLDNDKYDFDDNFQ